MTGGKRIKKATARHEFYLRLFGYCRGKCGLPHPELKARNVAASAPKRKARNVNALAPQPKLKAIPPLDRRSIPPKKRSRSTRRILALTEGPPIRSSFPTDPRHLSGGPVVVYYVPFETNRRKH
jgi:hypothetical protein